MENKIRLEVSQIDGFVKYEDMEYRFLNMHISSASGFDNLTTTDVIVLYEPWDL